MRAGWILLDREDLGWNGGTAEVGEGKIMFGERLFISWPRSENS